MPCAPGAATIFLIRMIQSVASPRRRSASRWEWSASPSDALAASVEAALPRTSTSSPWGTGRGCVAGSREQLRGGCGREGAVKLGAAISEAVSRADRSCARSRWCSATTDRGRRRQRETIAAERFDERRWRLPAIGAAPSQRRQGIEGRGYAIEDAQWDASARLKAYGPAIAAGLARGACGLAGDGMQYRKSTQEASMRYGRVMAAYEREDVADAYAGRGVRRDIPSPYTSAAQLEQAKALGCARTGCAVARCPVHA